MDDFISTIALKEPLDRDGLPRLVRLACLEIHRVTWLRAYLADDGGRMLCWYQAPDAESVRLVLRQQGSTEAPVRPVEVSARSGSESLAAGRDCVVVELKAERPDAEAVASTETSLDTALSGAGRTLDRVFRSAGDARVIGLVNGRDEVGVTDCLRAAGVAPLDVWQAVELDARPPKLFETSAAGRVLPAMPASSGSSPESEGRGDVLDAVIIGAGLSGICALHRFLRMGLHARIYEAGSDVGGVWHWNRYPGARVDSEIFTYGFAFSDELLREWRWEELFAPQPEIARYLEHVVERLDLRRHMHFGTRVAAARYDGRDGLWWLETDSGERIGARYLIAGCGTLSTPQLPDYPGMDDFSGESFHTARWPAAGVELAGKRVGVVGTGATGVQVIQTIAGIVEHLTVFQRTPTYCIPQRNHPLTEADRRRIRENWAEILAACRESYGGFMHTFDPRSGLAVPAIERESKFEELWAKPGFAFWFGNFADLMMNPEVNEHACDFLRRKIGARVHDPAVARKLLPDHPFGAKRVPLENGYYEVYNRGNVRLVDLRETPIERITSAGIRTVREEHPLDVIVYATGFDAGTGALTRIDIRGEAGVSLADKWRDGARTFLGLLVSGFPNLFIVNGPHNAAALCNAGRCIEQNVDWIARCIERMRAEGRTRIVPTAAAEDEWTDHVYETADTSVLAKMTDSWFFGANTPGKARRATIYAAGAREYREHCEDVAQAGYPGLVMS